MHGERRAGELGRGECPRERALGEGRALGGDLGGALQVGVEHGGEDHPVGAGQGDADVHAPMALDAGVAVGGVERRLLAQGERTGTDDDRVGAMAGGERRAQVDLGLDGDIGDRRARLGRPSRGLLLGAASSTSVPSPRAV